MSNYLKLIKIPTLIPVQNHTHINGEKLSVHKISNRNPKNQKNKDTKSCNIFFCKTLLSKRAPNS